jgi:hypothetical protein
VKLVDRIGHGFGVPRTADRQAFAAHRDDRGDRGRIAGERDLRRRVVAGNDEPALRAADREQRFEIPGRLSRKRVPDDTRPATPSTARAPRPRSRRSRRRIRPRPAASSPSEWPHTTSGATPASASASAARTRGDERRLQDLGSRQREPRERAAGQRRTTVASLTSTRARGRATRSGAIQGGSTPCPRTGTRHSDRPPSTTSACPTM